MPCQRPPAPKPAPQQRRLIKSDEPTEVAALKQKLREIEAERTAFFQEGVFDLVQFLCGSSENLPPSNSPWTQHVIDALADFRGARETIENLKRENAEMAHALKVVANACALTPRNEDPRALAQRLVFKFT